MKNKKILCTNKLMDKIFQFKSFSKLMLFCVPIILTGSVSYLNSQIFVFLPRKLTAIIAFLFAWQMFVCWALLFISFQVHWKRETRNMAANISIVSIALILLVLDLIF